MKFFDEIDTELAFEASSIILRMELNDIVSRLSTHFEIADEMQPILDRLVECDDSPKLRFFIAASKGMLRSAHWGIDPEPKFISHFQIDSLAAIRVAELHVLSALEIVVADLIAKREVWSWHFPSMLAPKQFDVHSIGCFKIPHDTSGISIQARDGLVQGAFGGSTFELLSNRNHRIDDGLLFLPATQIDTEFGAIQIPIHSPGLANISLCNAPIVLGDAAVAAWLPTLNEAVQMLVEFDADVARDSVRLCHSVLPLHCGGTSFGSSSPDDVMGMVFLPAVTDTHDVAECLLHEAMHQKLYRIEAGAPLFQGESGDNEIYYSPWRGDPRPLRMLMHGAFVFTAVALFWQERQVRYADHHELSENAAFHMRFRAQQSTLALKTIRKYAELTPMGERITALLCETLQSLDNSAVTEYAMQEVSRRLDHHFGRFGSYVH